MNMYQQRIASIRALLRDAQLDAAAIVPGANMRYLTGLTFHPGERLTLLLISAHGDPPCMVLPALEQDRARTLAHQSTRNGAFLHFYPWKDEEGPQDALREAAAHVLRNKQPATPTLAVEHTLMRVMELRALEQIWPGMQTVDAVPLLARLRMVKAAPELEAMTEAVRIIETALRNILPHIAPGVTERQLAAIWKNEILAGGAEDESFACMVASGPNSASPHHHNSNRAFQHGDLIILDGGALYAGYASDITRTVALGEPDTTARHIYELVQAANAAGRAAVRPGTTGEQIDQVTRQVITDGGYGDFFVHRTGHGLGMECHELPNIVGGSTQPLASGMTFTIEPGIYIAGVAGVRIEDDMVVTEGGGTSLTTFERDLIIL
jgi:Xaa-Pro aminopeptidase